MSLAGTPGWRHGRDPLGATLRPGLGGPRHPLHLVMRSEDQIDLGQHVGSRPAQPLVPVGLTPVHENRAGPHQVIDPTVPPAACVGAMLAQVKIAAFESEDGLAADLVVAKRWFGRCGLLWPWK